MAKKPRKYTETVICERLIPMPTETGTTPCVVYKGIAPKKGDKLRVTLSNGVTYFGSVADFTEVDGEVMVEFKDGLSPE